MFTVLNESAHDSGRGPAGDSGSGPAGDSAGKKA